MSTGPRRLGKYELQQRLGRGGTAESWKAFDTQLQRHVAIKFLHADLRTDPTFMIRFVREAQAIASLHHPNIVQVHDFQTSSDPEHDSSLAYMVMNYIEGPTLAEYIYATSHAGNFPSASDIIHLFNAIGSAIDYAHQHGMVHRDIKPANILFDKKQTTRSQMGEPILIDFGVVKLMDVAGISTLGGSVLGTPLYMAPEQAQGRHGNERSDIYSLGIILYEICTGTAPFRGDSASAIMVQHIIAQPTPPILINSNIPPALSEVILRCIAKNPAARFPSASAVSVAIAQALTASPTPTLNISTFRPQGSDFLLNPPSPQDLTSPSARSTPSSELVIPSTPPSTVIPPNWQSPSNESASTAAKRPFSADTEQNQLQISSMLPPLEVIASSPPSSLRPPLAKRARGTKRRKALLIVLIVLVLLVSTALSIPFFLPRQSSPTTPAISIVGHATYVSSGRLDDNSSPGIEDELQIDLSGIPPPAPGKSYYAWLLSDKTQNPIMVIPLGLLTPDHGNVSTRHMHDEHYTNLLGSTSRFLITEEDSGKVPMSPSPKDARTWRYYAELPQTSAINVGQSRSALDHIRNLLSLYQGGNIPPPGTNTALAIQFLRNVYQVQLAAKSARVNWDSSNAVAIHDQVLRILDYLDSETYITRDVPPGEPLRADRTLIQIPLYEFTTEQYPAGYFSRFDIELHSILEAPDITPTIQRSATQASAALLNIQHVLERVRQDATSLVKLSDTQLLQESARSILSDMDLQASYAYNGQGNTSADQTGATWILDKIESLATFDVAKWPLA